MNWLYLAIAIVAEVIATSALKSTNGFTRFGPTVLVVTGYCFALYMLSLSLRTIPIGIAYAIWAGAGIVLIALAGLYFHKEHLDMPAIVGMALIIAGVVVIHLFSESSAQQ